MKNKFKKYTLSKKFKLNIFNLVKPGKKLYSFFYKSKLERKFFKRKIVTKFKKNYLFKQNFFKIRLFKWKNGLIPLYILKNLWKNNLKKKKINKLNNLKQLSNSYFLKKNFNKSNYLFNIQSNNFKKLSYLINTKLTTILYQSNIVSSLFESKQLIKHGFIGINGKVVTAPHYICKIGDVVHVNKLLKTKAYSKLFYVWNYYKKNIFYVYYNVIIKKKKHLLPLFLYNKKRFLLMPWEKVKNLKKNIYNPNIYTVNKFKFFNLLNEFNKKNKLNKVTKNKFLKRNRIYKQFFYNTYKKYLNNFSFLKNKPKVNPYHLEYNSLINILVVVNYPINLKKKKTNKKKSVRKYLNNNFFIRTKH